MEVLLLACLRLSGILVGFGEGVCVDRASVAATNNCNELRGLSGGTISLEVFDGHQLGFPLSCCEEWSSVAGIKNSLPKEVLSLQLMVRQTCQNDLLL